MLRHDPHAAVLSKWARRPAVVDIFDKPIRRGSVVRMVLVEQRNQDIDVQ